MTSPIQLSTELERKSAEQSSIRELDQKINNLIQAVRKDVETFPSQKLAKNLTKISKFPRIAPNIEQSADLIRYQVEVNNKIVIPLTELGNEIKALTTIDSALRADHYSTFKKILSLADLTFTNYTPLKTLEYTPNIDFADLNENNDSYLEFLLTLDLLKSVYPLDEVSCYISYAPEDSDFAFYLTENLRTAGVEAYSVVAGADIAKKNTFEEYTYYLALLSPAYLKFADKTRNETEEDFGTVFLRRLSENEPDRIVPCLIASHTFNSLPTSWSYSDKFRVNFESNDTYFKDFFKLLSRLRNVDLYSSYSQMTHNAQFIKLTQDFIATSVSELKSAQNNLDLRANNSNYIASILDETNSDRRADKYINLVDENSIKILRLTQTMQRQLQELEEKNNILTKAKESSELAQQVNIKKMKQYKNTLKSHSQRIHSMEKDLKKINKSFARFQIAINVIKSDISAENHLRNHLARMNSEIDSMPNGRLFNNEIIKGLSKLYHEYLSLSSKQIDAAEIKKDASVVFAKKGIAGLIGTSKMFNHFALSVVSGVLTIGQTGAKVATAEEGGVGGIPFLVANVAVKILGGAAINLSHAGLSFATDKVFKGIHYAQYKARMDAINKRYAHINSEVGASQAFLDIAYALTYTLQSQIARCTPKGCKKIAACWIDDLKVITRALDPGNNAPQLKPSSHKKAVIETIYSGRKREWRDMKNEGDTFTNISYQLSALPNFNWHYGEIFRAGASYTKDNITTYFSNDPNFVKWQTDDIANLLGRIVDQPEIGRILGKDHRTCAWKTGYFTFKTALQHQAYVEGQRGFLHKFESEQILGYFRLKFSSHHKNKDPFTWDNNDCSFYGRADTKIARFLLPPQIKDNFNVQPYFLSAVASPEKVMGEVLKQFDSIPTQWQEMRNCLKTLFPRESNIIIEKICKSIEVANYDKAKFQNGLNAFKASIERVGILKRSKEAIMNMLEKSPSLKDNLGRKMIEEYIDEEEGISILIPIRIDWTRWSLGHITVKLRGNTLHPSLRIYINFEESDIQSISKHLNVVLQNLVTNISKSMSIQSHNKAIKAELEVVRFKTDDLSKFTSLGLVVTSLVDTLVTTPFKNLKADELTFNDTWVRSKRKEIKNLIKERDKNDTSLLKPFVDKEITQYQGNYEKGWTEDTFPLGAPIPIEKE